MSIVSNTEGPRIGPSGQSGTLAGSALRQPTELPRWKPVELYSDGELIWRAGEGDRAAFDILYQRFARSVFRLALRQLRDRGRAEDATQETFAAIWRSARTYRPDRGPGAPWLYAVARHAIVDQLRRRVEPAAEAPDSPSDLPGPLEHAESDWVRRRVHSALAEVPEDERTLIELAYWSGLTQAEIASRLGLPLGTVKTRTRRALIRLAGVLERDEAS